MNPSVFRPELEQLAQRGECFLSAESFRLIENELGHIVKKNWVELVRFRWRVQFSSRNWVSAIRKDVLVCDFLDCIVHCITR